MPPQRRENMQPGLIVRLVTNRARQLNVAAQLGVIAWQCFEGDVWGEGFHSFSFLRSLEYSACDMKARANIRPRLKCLAAMRRTFCPATPIIHHANHEAFNDARVDAAASFCRAGTGMVRRHNQSRIMEKPRMKYSYRSSQFVHYKLIGGHHGLQVSESFVYADEAKQLVAAFLLQ